MSRTAESWARWKFNLIRNWQTSFQSDFYHISLRPALYVQPSRSTFSSASDVVSFLALAILWYKWYLTILIFIFLIVLVGLL